MPAKVKVKVVAGRNLPVMDRGSDTTDAFVELRLGGGAHKTDVCRKSLNPQWACSEWFRFEVDDEELQDEPLQLRLMDHDTYSANDAIGKIYISLHPLLLPLTHRTGPDSTNSGKGAVMSGWIPVFDTMHGIRGEVNVIVKVELFNDFNKFRQSSCGVQFFHSPLIPQGYHVQTIHGFVEELVINDDPEYQWIDKIRTPRASNEARQVAFLKLSGQVQRKIGLKALELGANAVIGYNRSLDLEGEVGVVARGSGTAVTLVRLHEQTSMPSAVTTGNITNSPDTIQHLKDYIEFINSDNNANNQIETILNSFESEWKIHSTVSDGSLQDSEEGFRNLLLQEDMRRDIHRKSIKKSIQTFKTSSQSLLSKKYPSNKRLMDDDDRMSLASFTSERSLKFSFTDFKSEIKRKANFKPPLLKKPIAGDGSAMAASLARSIMHTHSSLDCIKETHESGSPIATMRRSSKSSKNVQAYLAEHKSEDKSGVDTTDNLESHVKFQFTSLDDVSSGNADKKEYLKVHKRSVESCPTTPLEVMSDKSLLSPPSVSFMGSSVSSIGCSSDDYSSSDSDDLSDDKKADDRTPDTISEVVRSVLEHKVDSHVIEHMDEKLKSISSKNDYKDNWDDNSLSAPIYEEGNLDLSIKNIEGSASAPVSAEIEHKHKFRFHFPNNIFRRYKSVSESEAKAQLPKKRSRLSLSSLHLKKNLFRTFSHGHKEEEPSLVKTAIQTILMEKVHILDDIINHGPVVDEEEHLSDFEHHDNQSEDFLSFSARETVLGMPFLSFNALRYASDPNLNIDRSPMLADTFSLMSLKSVDHDYHDRDQMMENLKLPYSEKLKNYIEDVERADKSNESAAESKPKQQQKTSIISFGPDDANNLSSSKGRTEKMPSGREKFSIQGGSLTTGGVLRPSMNQENIDLLEYPFLTIVKFPPGFIVHIGGSVTARSVKLVERVPNPEEPAPRDAWWSELRTEVRSHMRALRCNAVLGYQETTTICDDVCVLSATGTAAVIDLRPAGPHTQLGVINDANLKPTEPETNRVELTQTTSLDRNDFDKNELGNNHKNTDGQTMGRKRISERCGPCHLPYSSNSVPFQVNLTKCHICKKRRVPSVILCTIEPIEGLSIVGRGCLVQAVASKVRTPGRSEPAARDISDQLPFLEYELHRLLLVKLRVRGMNAIFGLKTTIAVGANLVAAIGVGTGVLLEALGPCTGGPRLRAPPGDVRFAKALQRGLDDALHANKDVYHLHMDSDQDAKAQALSETDESDEELPDIELSSGNKDTCILEVDDAEDLEVLKMLTEARPPAGLHVVNTQSVPGLPIFEAVGSIAHLQMFTQLWRARLATPNASLHPHFHRLLQIVYFKLRRMVPCAVCDLKFHLDLPEDEIQLVVTGMTFRIVEPDKQIDTKPENTETIEIKKSDSNEMIFTLDEEHTIDVNCPKKEVKAKESPGTSKVPFVLMSNDWRPSVVMTPLAVVPGGRILEYLGNLDFIFVRESTSVREQGGISGFLHTFVTEVLAIVRAHVTALSGNAIVAFYLTELILSDTPHKNQAQCLVSVGGDVVSVSYST